MFKLSRRTFLKLGAASAAAAAVGSKVATLQAMELDEGGRDVSPTSRKERQAVPSSCLQCVAVCGIIGYVEDGRLVKIEGNPEHPNNRGRLCPKGQAGVNQVYDPDRILYPLKRVGARGEGKWQRISWDEAYEEVASRLRKLRDEGRPEYFMFHYGRSRAKWILGLFTDAYGTKTIGNHTSICEAAKWVGQELVWGPHYDVYDAANTRFILNFGCNMLEAHTSHNYFAQRVVDGMAAGARLVTFDVRLSNTAARSHEWYPVRPGTDGLIALAMANVIVQEGLYDAEFINTWTNTTVDQLKKHLAQFTPQLAEAESGVSAADIRRLAIEFATNRPSMAVSYRGAVAHYNGVENERCIKLLDAIVGNIDAPGGTCLKVSGKWGAPDTPKPPAAKKKLHILDGEGIAYPTHHVNHQVFTEIKKKPHERPEVYMIYCYNPVYSNGDCQDNIDVMKDESMIPFIVAIDAYMSEGTVLADLILPDATYLERWDPEAPQSQEMIPFVAVRQPVVKPLGEAVAMQDMLMELARRIGGGMEEYIPFKDSEEYMRQACENTKGLKDVGGLDYIRKHGVFIQDTKKQYHKYAKELSASDLEGTTVDPETGTIFKGEKYEGKKNYVGIMINGKAYKGFKPDKQPISGKFELYSRLLEAKGFSPLPTYYPIPDHQGLGPDQLILTTYKVNVQTHSRTQNCKWLTEIYHDNPAWINPATAAARGIRTGDAIRIKSEIGEIVTRALVTEGVHPGVIAVSFHCGHWEYGRYASGKVVNSDVSDPSYRHKWWKTKGEHPNWVIPNRPDPIGGQQRWMDTVVTVSRA